MLVFSVTQNAQGLRNCSIDGRFGPYFMPKTEQIQWQEIVRVLLTSRAIDHIEETKLLPERKILYQFSARGHDFAQIVLGSLLTGERDAVSAYYRSRPMLLSLGLSIADAFAGPLGRSGGFSDGRDIGVVCNFPQKKGAVVLPMAGDVGSQYTPAAGWAQAITYHRDVLKDKRFENSIAVVMGGEGSVATNGFWSALTMATTLNLPILFYIEDNGYALSVTSELQTPGGNIVENLASFKNLERFDGDGVDPTEASDLLSKGVAHVRSGKGTAIVRLRVPRLSGHSGQDTQAYKSPETIKQERARDPLPRLKEFLVPQHLSESSWEEIAAQVDKDVQLGLESALKRAQPDCKNISRFVFTEFDGQGTPIVQECGGLLESGHKFPSSSTTPVFEPTRINLVTAVRRTLEQELKTNPKLVVFGEDVGAKGGVHAATMGLQESFGVKRVFDTSLSEEGIIGRAVGMAISGLMPVVEIQFRKYADPATEQLHNCGTIRWRTNNRFAAPIVVRMPGGFAKCGDPWHSMSDEVMFVHSVGWQVAYPSNAQDAVGLLRAAMRSNEPTIFFEHRHMLDAVWARRPYPGDDFIVDFGKATFVQEGSALTLVSWGAMVERCEQAVAQAGASVDLIDLRSLKPWDKSAVLASVKKTRRCLIVHEDAITAGFGAEVAATVAENVFFSLDAPVARLAVNDFPVPYNVDLLEATIPSVDAIANRIQELIET